MICACPICPLSLC